MDRLSKKFMGIYYEFSQGDLDIIQEMINELREYISKSLDMDDDFSF